MKATRIIGRVLVAGSLALLVATPALAGSRPRHRHYQGCGHGGGATVPELDPGLTGSAALLLIGGTLALRGRRRLEPQA